MESNAKFAFSILNCFGFVEQCIAMHSNANANVENCKAKQMQSNATAMQTHKQCKCKAMQTQSNANAKQCKKANAKQR